MTTDHLTGGPTEYAFQQLFQERLAKVKQPCALLHMDIKHFSAINMIYGRETGDKILKEVYHVLEKALGAHEFISHIHTDVFLIVVNAGNTEELEARIHALDDVVYYHTNFEPVDHIFFSIGAYLIPSSSDSYEHAADCANYSRTISCDLSDENTCYEIYGYTVQDTRARSIELLRKSRTALETGHFEIYLQPKYELVHETIAGAEALIRWKDPDEGMIPLFQFMPAFEESGFIRTIDRFVFESVLQFLQRRLDNGQSVVPISLNLSKSHFTSDAFFRDKFLPIFEKYHVPAELIEFEFSESLIVNDPVQIQTLIRLLQKYGFACSLDDFGSGYSCLNTIKTVPVSTLKLDQKMFTEEAKERGKIVVRGILQVAHELGMQVVSEGVETREYVDFLKENDGELVQGYYFSRPIPVKDFEALLP